jgi:hypothetical protein
MTEICLKRHDAVFFPEFYYSGAVILSPLHTAAAAHGP